MHTLTQYSFIDTFTSGKDADSAFFFVLAHSSNNSMMSIHDYHSATTTLTQHASIISVSVDLHSAPAVSISGATDGDYDTVSDSVSELYHAVDDDVSQAVSRRGEIDSFVKALFTSDEVASQWYLDHFQ